MSKPITPYQRLLTEIGEFCKSIRDRHEKIMWRYPMKDLSTQVYLMDKLHQRTMAADQLGYEVVLLADDSGIMVIYRKKIEIPLKWW